MTNRAQLWSTNLATVLQMWTGVPVAQDKPGNWELKKQLPPNLIRFVRVGDWVVFGGGSDTLPVNDELVRLILADKRPAPTEKNNWLTAELDWPRLAGEFPQLQAVDLPETQWQIVGRNGNLHLDGKLILPRPLALTLDKWRMPTNTIHEPLNSFTAVRGMAPWLEKQNWAQPYEISPVPNQMFIWALAALPLQTFAAVPVPDGKQALKEFEQKMSTHTNWQSHLLMPFNMRMTNDQISWRGMPFISPNLRALHEPNGDFLFAEVFPNTPRSKPLPPELFAQLSRTNLVYYDWEITGERLKLLPQLTQLALMFTRHKQLNAQSVAGKWLNCISPTLGIAVTEVAQTAPNELSFMRKATGGLTAFEFIALANWLEATNFPGCDLRLPPPITPFEKPFSPASSRLATSANSRCPGQACFGTGALTCSSWASILITSPRCARRAIVAGGSVSRIRSRPRGFAKPPAPTALPRIYVRTAGTCRIAMSGNCAKSSKRG